MRRADIEVPNRSVDMDSWDRSACYPRGTFYPLSDGPSTWDRRITRPCFRTCSTCRSRSQAPLCPCTRQLIADQLEGTFGRLRYSLGSLLARQLVLVSWCSWRHRCRLGVISAPICTSPCRSDHPIIRPLGRSPRCGRWGRPESGPTC